MAFARNCSCLLMPLLFAAATGACVASDDSIEDLGTLTDDKSDSSLPRSIEVDIAPGESSRFRITTSAFVASLAQDGDVAAQLTAKHYEYAFTSDVSPTPRIDANADNTSRNWTLTVYNRGTRALEATIVVDVPRAQVELGIVSDIDKTILPPETAAGLPPPYPGMATLLRTLELRASGVAGDVHYVTAREPDAVVDIPAWMAMHGVPEGSIDTGISGAPWIAQPEKVRDISRIFDTRVQQSFVLFGDTSHRDPEAYADVRAKYPTRIRAIFIHKVDATVPAARVDGMHLINNYAEAAAFAFGADLLTETEARQVMDAARGEGLSITASEIDALLDAAR